MKTTITRIFAAAAMLVTTLSPSSGQTTTTPPATTTTGNTTQTVTFQSDLTTLNSGTPTSNDRLGNGTAMTTMRLERNTSGKLVRAVVMVQLNSDTSQAENFNQVQLMGANGVVLTIPLTGSQATIPGQTYRTNVQAEITDAAKLAQIETFLRNPASYNLTFGSLSNPNGLLMGSIQNTPDTVLSRTEARQRALGSLDRVIYRLVVLMAYRDGTITQSERDSLMADLVTYNNAFAQADTMGSGVTTGAATGTATGSNTTPAPTTTP